MMESSCACCRVEDEENFVSLNGRDKKLNDTFLNLLLRITGIRFEEDEDLKICVTCLYTLKKSIEFVEMCITNNKHRILSHEIDVDVSEIDKQIEYVEISQDKNAETEGESSNALSQQEVSTIEYATGNVPVILNKVLRTRHDSRTEIHPIINYNSPIVNKQYISNVEEIPNIYSVEIVQSPQEQVEVDDEHFVIVSGEEDNLPISKLNEESETETLEHTTNDSSSVIVSNKKEEKNVETLPLKKKHPKYLCTVCGKSFLTNQRLKMHGVVHTDEKNFVCPEDKCEKRFATEFRLKVHTRTHKGEKPYKCKFAGCEASFAQGNALTCHNRIHTNSKPYKCQVCQKAFTQNTILKTHMALHTGKTIECPHPGCDKKFARKSFLKVHTREHTGEKPFKCTYENCNNSYMQKSHLSRHMDTHIGVTHNCPECSKSYTKAWSLKLHMYSHSQTKPYKCSFCDNSFLRRDKLNKHISKVHTEEQQKDNDASKAKPPDNLPEQVFTNNGNSYVLVQTNTNSNVSQVIGEIYIK